MTAFTDEVCQHPMFFSQLKVFYLDGYDLSPAQTTAN
jgi:hypothetical protein